MERISIEGLEWADEGIISLEILLRRVLPSRCETPTFKRLWNRLMDHCCESEQKKLQSEGLSPAQSRKSVRRGWAKYGGAEVDGNYHPVDVSYSTTRPVESEGSIELVLRRSPLGEWKPVDLGHLLGHPKVKAAYAARWTSMQRPDLYRSVTEILGCAHRDSKLRHLSSKLSQRLSGEGIKPSWLRLAREFEGFWEILDMAVNLGKGIAREELLANEDFSRVVQQGVVMEAIASGRGKTDISGLIDGAIESLLAAGKSPSPTAVSEALGLPLVKKSGRSQLAPTTGEMKALLRWRKKRSDPYVTMSWGTFQERVKDRVRALKKVRGI